MDGLWEVQNGMRLSDANSGEVVRNLGNDNFYRYERPSEGRARIRPLELFPNGLLVAKPVDTIVSAEIVVELVGQWSEGMVVSGIKGRGRELYEQERRAVQEQLLVLEAESVLIPPKNRGSFANRVKAVKTRLTALEAGLEDIGTEPIQIDMALLTLPGFKLRQVVAMPSGQPAQFLGFLPQGQQLLATVACKIDGSVAMLQIDPQALRPYDCRFMATV